MVRPAVTRADTVPADPVLARSSNRVAASVIIPAYNEGRVIARTLNVLTASMRPGELEIIVVCNGCTDDTAVIARRFEPMVRVVETPVGSKIHALNVGDRIARHFPRFYVDADVEIRIGAIRRVAQVLAEEGGVLAAAPALRFDFRRSNWAIRQFYRVWRAMPYWCSRPVGTGVYALTREGRELFGDFPGITADDEFVNLLVGPTGRRIVGDAHFRTRPVSNVRSLIRVRARHHGGADQLDAIYPNLSREQLDSRSGSLLRLSCNPLNWAGVLIYLYVTLMSKLAGRADADRMRTADNWGRDDAVRAGGAPADRPAAKPGLIAQLDDDRGVFAPPSRDAEPHMRRKSRRPRPNPPRPTPA